MPEFLQSLEYKGEIFSLTCAFLWATATLFFRKAGETLPAFTLNFYKNTFVLLLLIPTAYYLDHRKIPDLPMDTWQTLILSGIIGICFADFLFFKSLNLLGAGRNAIVCCSYSLFMFFFSSQILKEEVTWVHFAGSSLVILGIVLASLKTPDAPSVVHTPTAVKVRGVIYGLLAMALTAVGVIMVKPVMETNIIPVDQVAIFRLMAGISGAFIFIVITGKLKDTVNCLKKDFPWKTFLIGSFIGGYLAMTIWLLGYKYAKANIAAILNQTSTLFIVILATIFLKERITPGKAAGAILAFSGVTIILLNS